jgi:hypothetical protein
MAGGQLLPDPGWRSVARACTFIAYSPALWLLAVSGRGAWHGTSARVCFSRTPRGEEQP